jgi:hypothetical protein
LKATVVPNAAKTEAPLAALRKFRRPILRISGDDESALLRLTDDSIDTTSTLHGDLRHFRGKKCFEFYDLPSPQKRG